MFDRRDGRSVRRALRQSGFCDQAEPRNEDQSQTVCRFPSPRIFPAPSAISSCPLAWKIRRSSRINRFRLRSALKGRGNAKLIEMLPFQPPDGVELYDTQNDSKFFRTGTSFKDFSLLLIPRRAGQLTLPAIVASIFDPAPGKYVERRTEPTLVIAQPGPPGASSGTSGALAFGRRSQRTGAGRPTNLSQTRNSVHRARFPERCQARRSPWLLRRSRRRRCGERGRGRMGPQARVGREAHARSI